MPHVLEHLPGRIRKSFNSLAALLDREVFDEVLKTQVRVTAAEQFDQLVA
jgi:hypothetical protein